MERVEARHSQGAANGIQRVPTGGEKENFTKVLELLSKPAVYQWLEFIAHLAGGSCCPTIYFTDTGLLKKTLRLKDDK